MTRPTIQPRPNASAAPVAAKPPVRLPPRPYAEARDRHLIPACIACVILSVALAATLEHAWTAQIQSIVELQQ